MKPIYLDYNATTPVDPQVLAKMLPFFSEHFGNPASLSHQFGWQADQAVQNSRAQVAAAIGALPQEIFFTSGATESNNWVVRGLIDQIHHDNPKEPIHFITSPVEHSSVINAFKWAATQQGIEVSWAPVNSYGQVSVDEVRNLIRPTTKLMSFMWVNNEIGSINPMKELAALAKEKKVYFHSDATQAIGKLPVDIETIPVDLISFSSHKIYGPKGIGVLFIRTKNPKVQIMPLLMGGGHERGLRAGTLNVPGIVGLGEACKIAINNLESDAKRLMELRELLKKLLTKSFPEIQFNGHPTESSPNTLNVTFKNNIVPAQIASVAISRGSACHSGSTSVSQVLKALGLSDNDAQNTVRFSLGRATTEADIQFAAESLVGAIKPSGPAKGLNDGTV